MGKALEISERRYPHNVTGQLAFHVGWLEALSALVNDVKHPSKEFRDVIDIMLQEAFEDVAALESKYP